ncbi:hypothetical protein BY996DRAFT_6532257 [Phakopsora pachyrhizi]|uniref:Uncharacterized protein n=1 Tax=Phakopsora pachyrhizi TaxID=170000 RepID=A0AAV0ASC9_PHAPC|nr:hypothetical protein BY996DRAFT_6532257 [Phakopsora pachyrhizi]CAH7672353.1 hypothetical protein PPACK8108_LOCUS7154 [Phakopsora pachyrhizi]
MSKNKALDEESEQFKLAGELYRDSLKVKESASMGLFVARLLADKHLMIALALQRLPGDPTSLTASIENIERATKLMRGCLEDLKKKKDYTQAHKEQLNNHYGRNSKSLDKPCSYSIDEIVEVFRSTYKSMCVWMTEVESKRTKTWLVLINGGGHWPRIEKKTESKTPRTEQGECENQGSDGPTHEGYGYGQWEIGDKRTEEQRIEDREDIGLQEKEAEKIVDIGVNKSPIKARSFIS